MRMFAHSVENVLTCIRILISSLMQRDGLLDTYRSSFKLLEPEALRQMIL